MNDSKISSKLFAPVTLVTAALLLLGLPAARAQSNFNVATGDWNTPANWNPAGVPNGDRVFINNGGTVTIDNAEPAIGEFDIGQGDASTSDIDTVDQTSGSLEVTSFLNLGANGGTAANGVYDISGGTLTHDTGGNFTVGVNGGGDSSFTESGSGTLVTNSAGAVYIGTGASGNNAMNLDGGTFNNTSTGDFNVGDGASGNGTLNVAGGTLNLASNFFGIGHGTDSTGAVNVSSGSVTDTGGNEVSLGEGLGGSGTLDVTGGSFSTTTIINDGNNTGSTGLVELSGTGTITSNGIYIGNTVNAPASGPVTASGTFTQTGGTYTSTGGDTLIGGANNVGVYNLDGGQANVRFVHVGNATGGVGTLNVAGGTITATGDIEIGNNGGVGTINLGTGGLINTTRIYAENSQAVMNFNGGTYQSTFGGEILGNFSTDGAKAEVGNGGAVIDTLGLADSTTAPLVHNASANAVDGGLTVESSTGTGSLTLTANNTYTGVTTVKANTTLNLSGAFTNNIANSTKIDVGNTAAATTAALNVTGLTNSTLVLANAQALSGSGSVGGNVEVTAGTMLAPGNGDTSLLTVNGNVKTDAGALFTFDLAGTGINSAVGISGTLSMDTTLTFGDFTFNTLAGFDPTAGGTYDLMTALGGVSGFNGTLTGTVDGDAATITEVGGDAVVLTVAAPEPSAWLMLAAGLVVLGVYQRRRFAASKL